MIINQEESDSLNERNASPFHKRIHLLSEKIEDKISSLKKNSFRRKTIKDQYMEMRNNGNKSNNYQYNTIIPYNKKHHSKIKFKIPKNIQKDYRIKKIDNIDYNYNQKYSTIIARNKIHNVNDDGNDPDKEDIQFVPQTSRYNEDKKEKYLKMFLKDVIKSKYDNDENRDYNTVRINRSPFEYINQKKSFLNKIRTENIVNDDNELNQNNSSIKLEEKLDYEFEIRLLTKKLKEVKERNKKLKYKIIKIKNEQRIRKQKNKKNEFIISKVIQICKNSTFSGKNNFFSSFKDIYNSITNNNSEENKIDDLKQFPATNLFKNMLLNLMDMKYEFENIVLKDKFIDGVQNLFYNINERYKEFEESNNNNNKIFIYDNVRELIREEVEIKNELNEFLELGKCYEYFSQLCNSLNIGDLKKLVDYLKKMFIKTKVNFKQINQIKKIVTDINNTNNEINNYNDTDEKYRDMRQNYISEQRNLRKKNNSEIKINNKNSSMVRDEIKNSKQNSYIKDNNKKNPILRNKDNYLYNKIFYTLRYNNNNNDSIEKNKNVTLNKERIDLYDFNKQKNIGYFINEYNNKKKENISQSKNNSNLNKKKVNNLHYNKSSKISTLKSAKKLNDKSYNSIINLKKKELGLNNKIRSKIKSFIKDKKSKNTSKSIVKDFIYSLK